MKAAVWKCPSAPTPPPPTKNCPVGMHSGSKGATGTVACVPCILNQYKPTADSSSCLVCPAGAGLVGGNAGPHVDCKPCQGIQASNTGIVCQGCAPGTKPSSDRYTCDPDGSNMKGHAVKNGNGATYHDTWIGKTKNEQQAVRPVVTHIQTDGIKGYDTYRVSLKFNSVDALNIFAIYGTKAHPLQMPPAHQIDAGQTLDIGGIQAGAIATTPAAKYGAEHPTATVL
jgi:hypothetical protein